MTSWAKMSADLDSNPKVRKAGRDGRDVFLFVLRRNAALDLGGRLPLIHVEPWYLADQLMMSEEEARHGLSRAVTAGLLLVDDGFVAIVGWDDGWAKRPLTDGERQARRREKIKAEAELGKALTKSHEAAVTCHDSHGSEKKREEENREEKSRESALPRAAPKKPRKSQVPADWEPLASIGLSTHERRELERFRNHHRAKGSTFVDIEAAWRNWLSRAEDYTPRNTNSQQSALAAVLAIAKGDPS